MIDCLGREMNCCVFIAALVAATSVEVSITSGQKPAAIADKLGLLTSRKLSGMMVNQDFQPTRSPLVDTLFYIPIQTLIVVNEMVQSIANNLQMMGVRNRPDRVPVQKLEKHNRMLGGTA